MESGEDAQDGWAESGTGGRRAGAIGPSGVENGSEVGRGVVPARVNVISSTKESGRQNGGGDGWEAAGSGNAWLDGPGPGVEGEVRDDED
jgi:hypothetical protein